MSNSISAEHALSASAQQLSLKVSQTVPILRTFSVEKAQEFYLGFLGFTVDWEHRFDEAAPIYMQISRAGLTCCPGSTVFVRVTGLAELHREITAKNHVHLRPGVEQTFHGSKCMEVNDPFGNRIRFDETMAQPT